MRYVLMLNDMRSPNIENLMAVKVGTREELVAYHNGLLVEPYTDEENGRRWGKSFAKGTELEWFNPSMSIDTIGAFTGGIYGPVLDDVPDEVAMTARLSK